MSIETDAYSYIGPPLNEGLIEVLDDAEATTGEPVGQYRNALAEAAKQGKLTDETGAELAQRYLGLAAASWSATALIVFAREAHAARQAALSWSNGKSDRSSEVIVLERLADNAAEKVTTDLICLTY